MKTPSTQLEVRKRSEKTLSQRHQLVPHRLGALALHEREQVVPPSLEVGVLETHVLRVSLY